MTEPVIETDRLVLRDWRDNDRTPFHAMCNDPRVMATLGPLMSRSESDALIDRAIARGRDNGHTFWALERRADHAFLGWCGLVRGASELPIAGEPEIGWRLAAAHWGNGYATEAARGSLAWAWKNIAAPRVVAITSAINHRSQRVMAAIGMRRVDKGDFDHPNVAMDSALKPHVLFAIARPA